MESQEREVRGTGMANKGDVTKSQRVILSAHRDPLHSDASQSSIFGDACPREVVLAQRTGKDEKEILAEEALHEKLHVSPALDADCRAMPL